MKVGKTELRVARDSHDPQSLHGGKIPNPQVLADHRVAAEAVRQRPCDEGGRLGGCGAEAAEPLAC
ncbi:MAG TPA: hypothetical protein VEG60_25285, partial [Candidatus Binatia bacterium]|nr:hypothetical protein [Candidatus Binatia bacterium]